MIVLFDFDGVIADTESQYTLFWDRMGMDYLGLEDFGHTIKGQTLKQIFGKYFEGMTKEQEEIVPQLNAFESRMTYDYIPGAHEFMQSLKKAGIRSAIVTSSNDIEMANAYKAHPELKELVDVILTSEHFSKSKPDPECFLKGMEELGGKPEETVVFEDSFHGLEAARRAGMKIVGLCTTNPREAIEDKADIVIENETKIEKTVSLRTTGSVSINSPVESVVLLEASGGFSANAEVDSVAVVGQSVVCSINSSVGTVSVTGKDCTVNINKGTVSKIIVRNSTAVINNFTNDTVEVTLTNGTKVSVEKNKSYIVKDNLIKEAD